MPENIQELYKRIIIDIPYLRQISPAHIQRIYKVDYNTATSIIDMLEGDSLIGPPDGARPREVIKVKN